MKNHWTLLHRDVSFLGFPAVHAIIPEISYVNIINEKYIDKHIKFSKIKHFIKQVRSCSENELIELIKFIDANYYAPYDSILPLTGLPLNEKCIFSKINNLYFKFLLYCKLGDFKKAFICLDDYIEKNNLSTSKNGTFYRCLRETLYALKVRRFHMVRTVEVIKKLFDENIVNEVLNIICKGNYLIYFDEINCFNCEGCSLQTECRYPDIIGFNEKITAKYLNWRSNNNDGII